MGLSSFMLVVVTLYAATNGILAQPEDPPSFNFDCDRLPLDVPCHNNGTCHIEDGTCQCMDEYDGNDCSYRKDSVVELETCPEECHQRGVCVTDDDNVTSCVCTGAYHGDSCQLRRVHHTCTHDAMTMHVKPGDHFDGSVYILDQEVYPECLFDKDPENSFSKEIKLDACGSALEETDEQGDMNRSFRVLVQFDSMYVTEKDLEFEFVCKVLKSGSGINQNLDPFHSEKKDRPFRKQEVTEELNPVTMALTTEDGQPISGPQTLGQLLKLTFTLNGGDLYDKFLIDNITATNGQMEPYKQEVALVSHGCVPRRARMVTQFGGDATSEQTLTFKVFKLRLSDTLQFETNLRLCDGEDGCESADCTADPSTTNSYHGVGRHRRDVSDVTKVTSHPEDRHVLWTQLVVAYPAQWNQSTATNVQLDSVTTTRQQLIGCLDNTVFLLLVSGLVAIVIILAITTITLTARSCHRRSHGNAELPKHAKF